MVCLHVGSSVATPTTSSGRAGRLHRRALLRLRDVRRGRLALLEDPGAVPEHQDLPLRGRHRLGRRPARPARPRRQATRPMYGTWEGIDLTPREVMQRNFWFCSLEDASAFDVRDHVGVDHIIVETDYPHLDATWPDTQELLWRQIGHLPCADRREDHVAQRRRSCSATRCPRRSSTIPIGGERWRLISSCAAAPWSTAPARPARRADVAVQDGRVVAVGDGLDGDRSRSTPRGRHRDTRLLRHPHPLRRAGVLGPGAHVVVLARRHVGRRRQLRLLDRADAPRAPRRHRAHAPGSRGHVGAHARRRHRLELRDLRRIPRAVEARGTILNFGCYVGHSPVRLFVMGDEGYEREASPEEIERMRVVVAESMRAGALGFASSFSANHRGDRGLPVPSRNGTREEFVALASVLGEIGYGGSPLRAGRPRHLARQLRDAAPHRPSVDVDPDAHELSGDRPSRDDGRSTRRGARRRRRRVPAGDVPAAQDADADGRTRTTSAPRRRSSSCSVDPSQFPRCYADPEWRGRCHARRCPDVKPPVIWDDFLLAETAAHPQLIGRSVASIAS